jgi:hypothetical protein
MEILRGKWMERSGTLHVLSMIFGLIAWKAKVSRESSRGEG